LLLPAGNPEDVREVPLALSAAKVFRVAAAPAGHDNFRLWRSKPILGFTSEPPADGV